MARSFGSMIGGSVLTGPVPKSPIRALVVLSTVLLTGVLPVVFIAWIALAGPIHTHSFAFDFEHVLLPAGRDVLHGRSPFPPATREALSSQTAFFYPPFTAVLMAPFALLPVGVAAAIFTGVVLVAALLTFWVLGVRDWRCYGVIFLWPSTLSAVQTANLSLLIALGAALVWRYRTRPRLAGPMTGVLIAAKVFPWPLLVWLVATRRYASVAWAFATTVVLTASAWAVFGFAGFVDYFRSIRLIASIDERKGYTILATGLRLGLGLGPARALALLAAAAVLAAAILLGSRARDERRSFVLVLAAGLLFSPVVWLHYFAVLIVAFALCVPSFDVLWLLPLFLGLLGPKPTDPSIAAAVAVLVTFAGLMAVGLVRRGRLDSAPAALQP